MKKNKLDEMEKTILTRSTIHAYNFMLLVLLIWCISAALSHQNWGIPFYIILAQSLVKFIAKQIYRHQVDDERWKNSLISLTIIATIIVFAILFVIPISLIGIGR